MDVDALMPLTIIMPPLLLFQLMIILASFIVWGRTILCHTHVFPMF